MSAESRVIPINCPMPHCPMEGPVSYQASEIENVKSDVRDIQGDIRSIRCFLERMQWATITALGAITVGVVGFLGKLVIDKVFK